MRLLLPAAIVILLTLAGSVVPVRAQSLAEVAKKEEERRKTVKPVSKVLTNKDLGSLPPAVVTPPPPTRQGGRRRERPKSRAEPSADAPDKSPGQDQAYWGGRMKELRTQLERDEVIVEAIQTQNQLPDGRFRQSR